MGRINSSKKSSLLAASRRRSPRMAERETHGSPSQRMTQGPVATEPEVEATRPLVEEASETPTVLEASVEVVVDDMDLPPASAPTGEQVTEMMDSRMDALEHDGDGETEPVDTSPVAPVILPRVKEDQTPPLMDVATWHPSEALGGMTFTESSSLHDFGVGPSVVAAMATPEDRGSLPLGLQSVKDMVQGLLARRPKVYLQEFLF